MANSQNGYPANNVNLTSSRLVPGTTRKLRVRNGPAGDLLLWVAAQFDKGVEDIEQGILDDWGYAERPIRGGTTLSNHASGTAIDLNATAHPLGTAPLANFSSAEIATIHAIVARTEGCVRWGGDYTGRKDGMHFEINAPESRCAAVLAKLQTGGGGSSPGGGNPIPVPKPTPTEGIEVALLERIVVPASPTNVPINIRSLNGSPNARLIVRPPDMNYRTRVAATPVWQGHVYAFGDGDAGVGGDPLRPGSGFNPKVVHDAVIALPGALIASYEYSCQKDFVLEVHG